MEADYGIELVDNLKRGRQRLYRYVDTNYSIPMFRMNDEQRNIIEDAIYVLKQFEGEPLYDWVRTILMQIEGGFITRPRAGVYQINRLVPQTDIAMAIYQKSFLCNNPTLNEEYRFENHFYFEFIK